MKALPARLAAGGEAQVKMEEDIGDTTRKGLMSAARYYYYLPIAFSRICVYALKKRRRTISDVRMLMFLLRTPWLYLLGFKGKLKTPFGKVLIRNRDKMRSTAYGTFKTRFSYLEEISEVAPGKPFFPVVVDVGANVGDFTLAMAGHSGRVIAIEPGENNFASLTSNLKLNGVQNATALNIAAHNREET